MYRNIATKGVAQLPMAEEKEMLIPHKLGDLCYCEKLPTTWFLEGAKEKQFKCGCKIWLCQECDILVTDAKNRNANLKKIADQHNSRCRAQGTVELRPTLLAYAQSMERLLISNDHKTEWAESSLDHKLKRVKESVADLEVALNANDSSLIKKDCSDAGNFLCMIYDSVNGGRDKKKETK